MTQRLTSALKRRAAAWAGQMTSLAKAFAPAHVKGAISSKVEEKDEGTFIIRTTASRRIAPDARAQEYGSGLKARRGLKKKYTIRPKPGGKALAFPWEVANNEPERFSFLPDGRVVLPSVQHPGIQAANNGKGYIAPAANEIRKRGREQLSKEIRDAILGDIRSSFGRK